MFRVAVRGHVLLGHGLRVGVVAGVSEPVLTPQNGIRGLTSQIELCLCKGGLIQTQCPEHSAGNTSGCLRELFGSSGCPEVRGCDIEAARNSPSGTSLWFFFLFINPN